MVYIVFGLPKFMKKLQYFNRPTMELRVTSLFALIVCSLLGACSSQTTGIDSKPTLYPTYGVTLEFQYSESSGMNDDDYKESKLTYYPTYGVMLDDNDDDEGSSLARIVTPVVGFVAFVAVGFIGLLIKARRAISRESDTITPHFVKEKVDDIKETAVNLLSRKSETDKQVKEENQQQQV